MPLAPARRCPVGPVRSLGRDDLPTLFAPAYKTIVTADRLRDSHHRVARLLASGLRQVEVAARTGYSQQRIWQLANSPAMQDLIETYRLKVIAAFERNADSYYDLASSNMMKAERLIADRLEDADEEGATPIPLKDLALIARDGADRFGYGKKSTNVNINADFAAELEKAVERTRKAREAAASDSTLVEAEPIRSPA